MNGSGRTKKVPLKVKKSIETGAKMPKGPGFYWAIKTTGAISVVKCANYYGKASLFLGDYSAFLSDFLWIDDSPIVLCEKLKWLVEE